MNASASSRDTELEAKYVVNAKQLESVRNVLTALKDRHQILIAGIREEAIADQYFDTRDFALAAHNACLRLRKMAAPGYILSFKRNYQPVNPTNKFFSRVEIEGVPDVKIIRRIVEHAPWLAFHLAQESPERLVAGELEMFRSMGLYDVCRIQNNREIYTVLFDSDLKVEVCFDDVEASTIQESNRFYELECEYLSGSKDAFVHFCRLLEEEIPWLKTSKHNKYIQSLIALRIWKPSMASGSGMTRVWQKQLNKIFKRLSRKYSKALDFKNPEDLHQTRVSIRQLITLLGFLLHRHEDKKSAASSLLNRLKNTQKILGKIRDYDVFIDAFEQEDPEFRASSDVRHEISHLLSLERDRVRLKAIRKLPNQIEKDLRKLWERFVDTELPKMLRKVDLQSDYMDLKRRFANNAAYFFKSRHIRGPLHPITVKNLHRTRILSKNLRYAAEYLAFALPGEQDADIGRYKQMQTMLGNINDLHNHLRLYQTMKDNLGSLIGGQLDNEIQHVTHEIENRIVALHEGDFHQGIAIPVDGESQDMANADIDAIKGIGPRTAEQLRAFGIDSILDIANLSFDTLEKLAMEGYDIRERVQREEWILQAQKLLDT